MVTAINPENLFWRNFDYANMIDYNLGEIYGEEVAIIFEIQAKFMLQDPHVIALVTTSSIAYFSNQSKILLDNCTYMEKGLASYTVITTCSGFSKSDTFLEISNACNDIDELETQFNLEHDDTSMKNLTKGRSKKITTSNSTEYTTYVCKKILNEFTGPGCIAALAEHSNILGLFDEFDDDSQKTNIFPSKDKFTNSMINCKSFIQTVFSCPSKYVKATADRLTILRRPRLSIIGGSNGSILTEIIRKKMNNNMIADPMVERFEFVSIRSNGTLVANRLKTLPQNPIRVAFLLLFVHMINGKTFMFNDGAQNRQQNFTDELTARSLRFERHDAWLSVRFRKSREYSLRMCAYLAIIKLAYQLAYEFVVKQPAPFNSYDKMTLNQYKKVKKYIDEKNLPDVILIDEETVERAHKATLTMILKYINLTSTDLYLAAPIIEVPVGPSATTMSSLGMTPVPTTQEYHHQQQQQQQQQQQRSVTPPPTIENNKEFKSYCKALMMIDSVVFTRSSIHKDSQLKKNLQYFGRAVSFLTEIKLLLTYTNGMITADGRTKISCYVKALPSTQTHNTILRFSNILDLIDVQYPLYIAKFNAIWLPDRNQCSDEVLKLLNDQPYNMYNFEFKYLPSKSKPVPVNPSMTSSSIILSASSGNSMSTTINIQEKTSTLEQNNTNNIVSEGASNTSLYLDATSVISSLTSRPSVLVNGNVPRLLTTTDNQSTSAAIFTTTLPHSSPRSSTSESTTVDKEIDQMELDTSVQENLPPSSSKKKIIRKRKSHNLRKRRK